MTSEENGTTQQQPEQSPIPRASEEELGSSAPKGLIAGPLRMSIAGLLVGLIAWQIVHRTYPLFEAADVPVENERSPTQDEEQQMKIAEMEMVRISTMSVGVIVGGLAALAFALVEGIAQGRIIRALAITIIAILFGAGLGAVGGYLSVSFQFAYEHNDEVQPIARAIGTQGIFWLLMASGIGLGLALFAGRVSLAAGTFLQAALAAVLFVIVYVPLAGLLFPRDTSECTIPASSHNIAVWAVSALGLIGLMLGLARVRPRKKVESSA